MSEKMTKRQETSAPGAEIEVFSYSSALDTIWQMPSQNQDNALAGLDSAAASRYEAWCQNELPDPATIYKLYDMHHKRARGEELTGHELAILYGFEVDNKGCVTHDAENEFDIDQTFAHDIRYENRGDQGSYRYNDYQKMAQAFGVTVGDLVEALSLGRINRHGDFQYREFMADELGVDDGKKCFDEYKDAQEDDEELDSESWKYFVEDPTINIDTKILFLYPAMILMNKTYFEHLHGHEISYDTIAAAVRYDGMAHHHVDTILSHLESIHGRLPSMTLADVGRVTGMTIDELLTSSENVREVFGDGEVVEGVVEFLHQ